MPCLFRQDTCSKLVRAHFQAEERDAGTHCILYAVHLIAQIPVRAIERDIGDKRGFAHARPPCKNDQIAIVQAADFLVDAGETGGFSRNIAARIDRAFDHAQRLVRCSREGRCFRLPAGTFGYFEQGCFGFFDLLHRGDIFRCIQCPFDQISAHRHQFAQQSEIVDLFRQFARREQTLPVRRKPGEIGDPAQFLQRIIGFEIGFQRHRRHHGVAIEQSQNTVVDAAMHRFEKMFRAQRCRQFLDHAVVDQHRAQKSRFGFDIGWQRTARQRIASVRSRVGGGAGVGSGAGEGGGLRHGIVMHGPAAIGQAFRDETQGGSFPALVDSLRPDSL